MPGNTSDCCNGLKFPDMPHLHAENCPTRSPDFKGVVLLRENPRERQQFNMGADLFGHPLLAVASALDTFGRMQRGGSYAEQMFIMANECTKAKAALDGVPRWLHAMAKEDREAIDALKTGDPVLARTADHTQVVWWENKIDYKDTCDTDTLAAGWVTGERVGDIPSKQMDTRRMGKYVTVDPVMFMKIPE